MCATADVMFMLFLQIGQISHCAPDASLTHTYVPSIDSHSLIKSAARGIDPTTAKTTRDRARLIKEGARIGTRIGTSLNSKGREPCRVDSRDSAQTYFHVTSIPFIDSIFTNPRERGGKGWRKKEKELRERSPARRSSMLRFVTNLTRFIEK